ncbi:MAG: AAA family ATPase [Candidatus Omnitrophica bacterium]|nr:AAA family ATPase [Candidatus Omnitrophota bacterium]MCM8807747.1 AAA family ATPase [Candidatus Omnitrophota bacterium]
MRKIAVINQKGGSGKTTTVVNIGYYLAKADRKVLLIDLDPQSHTTIHLGFDPPEIKKSLYDLLVNQTPLNEVLKQTNYKNLDLIPSRIELASAEIELVNEVGREIILKKILEKNRVRYDYVIMDCPPSLGLLTLNALTTAKEIFIPIQAEFFALEGLTKLFQTIKIVKERLNSDLEITGIIITMYDKRKNICRDVEKKVEEYFKDKVFKTRIRENVRLAEAPSYGKAIGDFDPGSYGAEDYENLVKEILKQENKK